MNPRHTIPARRGSAAYVQRGQLVTVINTHGKQVVDTWAFVRHDLREFMSMEHTPGDAGEDHARGGRLSVHDPSPADPEDRRRHVPRHSRHAHGGLRQPSIRTARLHGIPRQLHRQPLGRHARASAWCLPETPSPLNLFMNIPWQGDGALSFDPPVTRPGDSITFEAQLDAVVAFSACPQDILPINGTTGRPTEAHFEISEPIPKQGGNDA